MKCIRALFVAEIFMLEIETLQKNKVYKIMIWQVSLHFFHYSMCNYEKSIHLQKTYCRYESGQSKVSAERLLKIADILEVLVQDLLPESSQSSFNNYDQKWGNAYNFIFINNDDLQPDTKNLPNLEDKLNAMMQSVQKLLDNLPKK